MHLNDARHSRKHINNINFSSSFQKWNSFLKFLSKQYVSNIADNKGRTIGGVAHADIRGPMSSAAH